MKSRKPGVAFALVIGLVAFLISPGYIFAQDDAETCMACHEDKELVGNTISGKEISVFVSYDKYSASVHSDMECVDCHTDLSGLDDYPHEDDLEPVDCGECHDSEAEIYQWHGRTRVGEGEDLPTCADCHSTHNILSSDDVNSSIHHRNMPATCNVCHENRDLIDRHKLLYSTEMILSFKSSVHGMASMGGVGLAATCNDCHSTGGTAHRILGPGHQESSINHFNIPQTCGKCHPGVMDDFYTGIHGELVAQGETDPPVCTNCHGEHGILSPADPKSSVSPSRVAEATCSPCHESAYLNEKYGVPTGRLQSWVDSYHGLKSKAGDAAVANCASCHEAHKILPSSDTASSVYAGNLQKTCGNCHPNISETLAKVPVHSMPGISQTPMAGVVADIYIVIIFVVIGGMILHWLVDLRKQIQRVLSKKQIRRMTYNAAAQHWVLMISFIVLVITGFSLRYSHAFWVQWLFGWDGGFPLRGIIHRVAAVVLTLGSVWHIIYLMTSHGRGFFKDMLPGKHDLKHFWSVLKYNMGWQSEHPRARRFSYVEKAEYWALVWGTIVMIVTGFLLWFDNLAIHWLPKGSLDITLVIHYYEAWLATLAILVWHLYSTVFSPTVYPMNPAWISGKMPADMYEIEHPDAPLPIIETTEIEEHPTSEEILTEETVSDDKTDQDSPDENNEQDRQNS